MQRLGRSALPETDTSRSRGNLVDFPGFVSSKMPLKCKHPIEPPCDTRGEKATWLGRVDEAEEPMPLSLVARPVGNGAPGPSRGSNEAHNGKAGTMTSSLGLDGVGRMLRVVRGRGLARALALGTIL